MDAMLTHLHHTPRVGPTHHRWARDAVVAAQLGAAALVVVTALEWRHDLQDDGAPGRTGAADTELVQTGDVGTGASAGSAYAEWAQPGATSQPGGLSLPVLAAAPVNADTSAAVPAEPAAAAELGVPAEPGVAADSAGFADPVVPADPTVPANAAVPDHATPADPSGPASIAVSVEGGGTGEATPALGALAAAFEGPVEIRVIDEASATVATAIVNPGDVARIVNLPTGTYRLLLSQTTGVTEPSPGVAISAARVQRTDPVELIAGDVLLISLQPRPTAAG